MGGADFGAYHTPSDDDDPRFWLQGLGIVVKALLIIALAFIVEDYIWSFLRYVVPGQDFS